MTDSEGVLPAYEAPPIDEVVVGVQFPPIPNFYDAHAGLYWQREKSYYPKISSQPRIEGPIESLSPPQALRFEIPLPGAGQPQNRTWLLSDNEEYLIQIQNTRFIVNWRRRQGPYPRFPSMRDRFLRHYADLGNLLSDEGLDRPRPQQVEISYINWITDLPVESFLVSAASTSIRIGNDEIRPEDQNWLARYSIGSDPSIVKRLYVQCQPAIRVQDLGLVGPPQNAAPQVAGQQGYQFGLTFKAARSSGLDDAEITSLLEEGREVVVPAFTELTSSQAHKIWGKYQ